jgi:ATP-binding protein involved in chromosome partitioning
MSVHVAAHPITKALQVMLGLDVSDLPAALQGVVLDVLRAELTARTGVPNDDIHIAFVGATVRPEADVANPTETVAHGPAAPNLAHKTASATCPEPVNATSAPNPSNANARSAPLNSKPIPGVQNIILVASGKGGVGKSTTALNVAMALAGLGLRVGILDADIYGPSLPLMIGAFDKPDVTADKKLIPIQRHGLSVMSMGFLIDRAQPVIWRGPMVQNALQQLLFDVDWSYHHRPENAAGVQMPDRGTPVLRGPNLNAHGLDVLVIDTPPGTGDVHLTLAQKLSVDGAIIVSTPQDMALIDAIKAHGMFQKVGISILGIIENMSYFCCPNCGVQTDIFSQHGAENVAKAEGIPFLGAIPLDVHIRKACDTGAPLHLDKAAQTLHGHYTEIAKRLCEALKLPSKA